MSERSSPTVWHRRVTSELRRLREATGKSAVEVALHMGWNRTKVNRIERGEWKRLNPQDVRALTAFYDTAAEEQEVLVEMASRARHKGWWLQYADILGSTAYIGLESDASVLRTFELLVVPGLLQTPEYHEAGIRALSPTDETEIRARIEVRQRRQRRIDEDQPLVLRALVDEGALWKQVGTADVMRKQLQRLIEENRKSNVELRIVPNSAGLHPGLYGAFVLMEFPFEGAPSVVFLETPYNDSISYENSEVEKYRGFHDKIHRLALTVEASQLRLKDIRNSYSG